MDALSFLPVSEATFTSKKKTKFSPINLAKEAILTTPYVDAEPEFSYDTEATLSCWQLCKQTLDDTAS